MDGSSTTPSVGPFSNREPDKRNLEVPLSPGSPAGKPFGLPSAGSLFGDGLTGACPKKIHEWTERGRISFKYTEKKTERLITEAKKKMEKKKQQHLECAQCNESFSDESELRHHYNGKEHHEKVREKSESKILGDLTKFARVCRVVLRRSPPTNQSNLTQSNDLLSTANQVSVRNFYHMRRFVSCPLLTFITYMMPAWLALGIQFLWWASSFLSR